MNRVALVIRNSSYRHANRLRNPVDDAVALGAKLKLLQFDVETGTDLSRDDFVHRLERFEARIGDADAAFFFFAGHGLQVNNANYLIPVDSEISQEHHLTWRTIELNKILAAMTRRAQSSILFLDACRRPYQAGQPVARLSHRRVDAVGLR